MFFEKSAPTEWSPLPLAFSPLGTYICSLHPPLGAALWVSRTTGEFERVMRLPSRNVQKADFSAHEELVTLYSVVTNRSGAPDIVMTVFDVRSGRKLRTLQVREVLHWPVACVFRFQIHERDAAIRAVWWHLQAPM